MAQFSIEIADDQVMRVIGAIAANYNYQATLPNPAFDDTEPEDPDTNPSTITNPETISQFANRMVRKFMSDHVIAYEKKVAKETAAAAVDTNVNISDPLAP